MIFCFSDFFRCHYSILIDILLIIIDHFRYYRWLSFHWLSSLLSRHYYDIIDYLHIIISYWLLIDIIFFQFSFESDIILSHYRYWSSIIMPRSMIKQIRYYDDLMTIDDFDISSFDDWRLFLRSSSFLFDFRFRRHRSCHFRATTMTMLLTMSVLTRKDAKFARKIYARARKRRVACAISSDCWSTDLFRLSMPDYFIFISILINTIFDLRFFMRRCFHADLRLLPAVSIILPSFFFDFFFFFFFFSPSWFSILFRYFRWCAQSDMRAQEGARKECPRVCAKMCATCATSECASKRAW